MICALCLVAAGDAVLHVARVRNDPVAFGQADVPVGRVVAELQHLRAARTNLARAAVRVVRGRILARVAARHQSVGAVVAVVDRCLSASGGDGHSGAVAVAPGLGVCPFGTTRRGVEAVAIGRVADNCRCQPAAAVVLIATLNAHLIAADYLPRLAQHHAVGHVAAVGQQVIRADSATQGIARIRKRHALRRIRNRRHSAERVVAGGRDDGSVKLLRREPVVGVVAEFLVAERAIAICY